MKTGEDSLLRIAQIPLVASGHYTSRHAI